MTKDDIQGCDCDECAGADWPKVYDIAARANAGETIPFADVVAATGRPLPRTRTEVIAEMERMTGLDIETIERITGRNLRDGPEQLRREADQ